MRWLVRLSERLFEWSSRHKWEWRACFAVFYSLMLWSNLTRDEWSWWATVNLMVTVLCAGALAWLWWRQDAIAEFEKRTRAAIGSDANIMILTASIQLRTTSIWKLNRVMRRYDIMAVPVLDLPQEAKELRVILESLRTK